jgi:DNA invertase Pin-like site-specific DNA recombinase
MGTMFFIVLATFAEFEVDLLKRTREGMAVARAKGRLKGCQPKLTPKQQKKLCPTHGTGDYTTSDLAEPFKVSRQTLYCTLQSQKRTTPTQ